MFVLPFCSPISVFCVCVQCCFYVTHVSANDLAHKHHTNLQLLTHLYLVLYMVWPQL